MQKKNVLIDSQSEEVQELMGRTPSWILRYGISVIAFTIFLLIGGSYFLWYPETLSCSIVVNIKKDRNISTCNMIGYATIPPEGIGKLKINQDAKVFLDELPENDYGYLKGKIKSISYMSNSHGYYSAVISFPQGNKTVSGVAIPPLPKMRGTVDIVICKRRLIVRYFAPIENISKMIHFNVDKK